MFDEYLSNRDSRRERNVYYRCVGNIDRLENHNYNQLCGPVSRVRICKINYGCRRIDGLRQLFKF